MLGQVCHSRLYKGNPNGFQEVHLLHLIFILTQSFVFHARNKTFYIFYAMFPNRYLRDIVVHGAEYKARVPVPTEIVIRQSKPFRMWNPTHQAEFFKLLSKVLCYLVSGQSHAGYLAAQPWNPYFVIITSSGRKLKETENDGTKNLERRQRIEVFSSLLVAADFQVPWIDDGTVVAPYLEEQIRQDKTVMDEDGELDNESDADYDDLDDNEKEVVKGSNLVSGMHGENSPGDCQERTLIDEVENRTWMKRSRVKQPSMCLWDRVSGLALIRVKHEGS